MSVGLHVEKAQNPEMAKTFQNKSKENIQRLRIKDFEASLIS